MARNAAKRLVKIPDEYLLSMEHGRKMFPGLYQLENGLRIIVDKHLSTCYGTDWWETTLRFKLPKVYNYARDVSTKMHGMPYIGDSAVIPVKGIHLITLGQIEEIIKAYRSDCIPELFPTLEFFLGHMEIVKRVRNLFSHMFPCFGEGDITRVQREIETLAEHIDHRI